VHCDALPTHIRRRLRRALAYTAASHPERIYLIPMAPEAALLSDFERCWCRCILLLSRLESLTGDEGAVHMDMVRA
jgi:hypothetical protein